MLTFLVSAFAKLKTNALLVTLGLLGLVALAGLSYKAGRSDGYELAQANYLKSVDQNKDQVIQELHTLHQKQIDEILLNRQTNKILSKNFRDGLTNIELKLGQIPYEAPTVISSDCRAGYDGTIGVFQRLAKNPSDSSSD